MCNKDDLKNLSIEAGNAILANVRVKLIFEDESVVVKNSLIAAEQSKHENVNGTGWA